MVVSPLTKEEPNDIDGCWTASGVKEENLHLLDENFWKFSSVEEFQKCREKILAKYGPNKVLLQ